MELAALRHTPRFLWAAVALAEQGMASPALVRRVLAAAGLVEAVVALVLAEVVQAMVNRPVRLVAFLAAERVHFLPMSRWIGAEAVD